MTHQTVKTELENNDIQVLTPDHEMYWDDKSIVFPYRDKHILLYISPTELTYFLYEKEWDDEWEEWTNATFHWGTEETVEDMLKDLDLI